MEAIKEGSTESGKMIMKFLLYMIASTAWSWDIHADVFVCIYYASLVPDPPSLSVAPLTMQKEGLGTRLILWLRLYNHARNNMHACAWMSAIYRGHTASTVVHVLHDVCRINLLQQE